MRRWGRRWRPRERNIKRKILGERRGRGKRGKNNIFFSDRREPAEQKLAVGRIMSRMGVK